jgi:hypothetical protein
MIYSNFDKFQKFMTIQNFIWVAFLLQNQIPILQSNIIS